jgi:hypothetical protein
MIYSVKIGQILRHIDTGRMVRVVAKYPTHVIATDEIGTRHEIPRRELEAI